MKTFKQQLCSLSTSVEYIMRVKNEQLFLQRRYKRRKTKRLEENVQKFEENYPKWQKMIRKENK